MKTFSDRFLSMIGNMIISLSSGFGYWSYIKDLGYYPKIILIVISMLFGLSISIYLRFLSKSERNQVKINKVYSWKR